jgi:cytochrome c oxidase subunit II
MNAWLINVFNSVLEKNFSFNLVPNLQASSWLDTYLPLEDISTNGYRIDGLFNYITYANIFFFSLVLAALIGFSWVYRERKGDKDQKVIFTYGNTKKLKWIVLGIGFAVFVGIDTFITYKSNDDLLNIFWKYPKKSEAYNVEVMGQQWMWAFRHAGNDGLFNTADDVVDNHELRIPVNNKISVQLTSKDVIHSLFIPNVRMKTDAIPGRISRMWFDTNKVGEYGIACAEMCGASHYRMQAKLIVMEEKDFNQWLKEASTLASDAIDRENPSLFWGWKWGLK